MAALMLAAFGGAASAEDAAIEAPLADLSIEELSQVKVTSVSKRPEPVGQAASSVYVITGDVIARAGAMSLPEALRLAPNLEVMRIDALDYSITARGFAGFESATKLLALVDGRSIYTPLGSGVDWDQHHLLLDDIERIEVISGPGGTLWGANAVNGVVNVTTKSAFDTEGVLAAANVGTLDSDLRLRIGRRLADGAAGRVYATAFKRGDLDTAAGLDANDGWDGWRAGARVDIAGDRDAFTVQGELQDADVDANLGTGAGYVRGGHALGRWTRRLGETASFEVQAYYDTIKRQARGLNDRQRTWDAQAQGSVSLGRHQLVAGGGYRITRDRFRTLTEPQLLQPPRRTIEIGNVFVQDEITLTPDVLLTLGVKLETNSYTRSEWMPSARLGWRLSERQFAWASVSRAIRNPSRIERDFTFFDLVIPGVMQREELIAYELGWRGRVTERASASVTLFFHDYDDLRTNDFVAPGTFPIFVGNSMEGETWGVEAWADVQLTERWRITVGGTALNKDARLKPGSLDLSGFESFGNDPDYWLKINSHYDLTERMKLDVGLRHYARVPPPPASGYLPTKAYTEAEVRLGWQVTDALEVSLTGLNLLHDRHPEASEARRSEIPRSVHFGLRWTP